MPRKRHPRTFADVDTGDFFISASPAMARSLFGVHFSRGMGRTPTIPDTKSPVHCQIDAPSREHFLARNGVAMVTPRNRPFLRDSESETQPQDRVYVPVRVDAHRTEPLDAVDIVGARAAARQAGLMIWRGQFAKLSKWLKKPLSIGDTFSFRVFLERVSG